MLRWRWMNCEAPNEEPQETNSTYANGSYLTFYTQFSIPIVTEDESDTGIFVTCVQSHYSEPYVPVISLDNAFDAVKQNKLVKILDPNKVAMMKSLLCDTVKFKSKWMEQTSNLSIATGT